TNKALEFDIDEYVEVADSDGLSFGNGITDSPFSISLWVRKEIVGTVDFIGKFEAPLSFEYEIFATAANLAFTCDDASNGKWIGRLHEISLSQNVWYHIVGTYDGSGASSGFRIHLDGIRVDSENYESGGYVAMENTTGPFTIGGIANLGGCSVDNVMIFDRVLSDQEITNLYNSGKGTEATLYCSRNSPYSFSRNILR
ncbi:unnamed protein product, partial [marine sediment metagenome]